jgi:hypothetical protein
MRTGSDDMSPIVPCEYRPGARESVRLRTDRALHPAYAVAPTPQWRELSLGHHRAPAA